MTPPAEQRPGDERDQDRRTAFGIALAIDRRLAIPGLGYNPDSVPREPPTRVLLDDSGELRRRWQSLHATPQRVRELRSGEAVVMSVDFAEPAGYLLRVEQFGRILISADGTELLCEADPVNSDWSSIIAAQALPLAATIRGLEVFHASGVVLDGTAVLFAGAPGAGKSSLAAALVRSGARLLSDDAVALRLSEGTLTAYPGSVVLQLRDAENERLSADARAALGPSASPAFGKQRYVDADVPDPAAVARVFLLERSSSEPVVEALGAVNPFELIASTFNLSVRTPARLCRQLDVASTIASNGLAHRLRVQPGIDATQLAAIVQAQLAAALP